MKQFLFPKLISKQVHMENSPVMKAIKTVKKNILQSGLLEGFTENRIN